MDSLAQYAGVWSTGVCTANDLVIGETHPSRRVELAEAVGGR